MGSENKYDSESQNSFWSYGSKMSAMGQDFIVDGLWMARYPYFKATIEQNKDNTKLE